MHSRSKTLLCAVLLSATAAFGQELPQPESTPVARYGGAGLDTTATFATTFCGETADVVWREVRRDIDPEGGTHVFYRQYIAGTDVDVELVGSEVAEHRLPSGKLMGVSGRQFDSVVISGCPAISAAKAVDSARERVLLYKGEYEGNRGEPWTMDVERVARMKGTTLKLVQVDGVFRPAYFTVAQDGQGEPYSVVLDAVNERLIAVAEANPGGNCLPNASSQVTAYGIPVRPEITSWRTMKANVATRYSNNYTHEGLWTNANNIRNIVYHGITDTNWRCGTGKSYTVHPLKVNPNLSTSPVYDNYDNYPDYTFGFVPFYGRAAGDALWHTSRTMDVFKALGRNGWDGVGGDARIVVHAYSTLGDQGKFVYNTSSSAPLDSVALGAPNSMYNGAAAIDHVAHEWGHGVIFKTANFPLSGVGLELHEGFADVIGMLVEKRAQASGTGVEQSSDWKIAEDMATSGYARAAIDDDNDNDGMTGHRWQGPNGYYDFDDRLHRLDSTTLPSAHATGNLLNAAHLIMAAGGSTTLPSGLNPVCSRLWWIDGCESSNAMTVSEYLGSSKAGALLFHAIQFTVTSTTTWSDVADRVNEAAFQKYNQCQYGPQYNAAAEQNAVKKAFAGIGYPRTQSDIQCP